MAWIEPKTVWEPTEYFNIFDYNRIVGNLNYLKELAEPLFGEISFASMQSEKTVEDKIFPREFNAIEDNLWLLNDKTYKFSRYEIDEKRTYKNNGKTPTYEDFNRIEYATLKIYEAMTAQKAALPRLAFTLGMQKGIQV